MKKQSVITFIGLAALTILFAVLVNGFDSSIKSSSNRGESVTISGSLTYPSDRIPDGLTICAQNTETNEETCTNEYVSSDEHIYGLGYQMDVSGGTYQIYVADQQNKAYFNQYMQEFVSASQWPDYDSSNCASYEPIVISTDDSKALEQDIAVGDWYYENNCN